MAYSIPVRFTNHTPYKVAYFLNGGSGLETTLGPGLTADWNVIVDPGVPPFVGIHQLTGERLDFSISDHGNYLFQVIDGEIKNTVSPSPQPINQQQGHLEIDSGSLSPIENKYAQLGGATSFLGQPITQEQSTPGQTGRFRHYQGGSIYFSPATGAHFVRGDIKIRWANIGWEKGILGFPITDETKTPDGVGRFNHFQNGSIYWTPQSGAHEIHGDIQKKWAKIGWEKSLLKYPISAEVPALNGRVQHFQRGTMYWSSDDRNIVVLTPAYAENTVVGFHLAEQPTATNKMCLQVAVGISASYCHDKNSSAWSVGLGYGGVSMSVSNTAEPTVKVSGTAVLGEGVNSSMGINLKTFKVSVCGGPAIGVDIEGPLIPNIGISVSDVACMEKPLSDIGPITDPLMTGDHPFPEPEPEPEPEPDPDEPDPDEPGEENAQDQFQTN